MMGYTIIIENGEVIQANRDSIKAEMCKYTTDQWIGKA
jgi:hypothetical protein